MNLTVQQEKATVRALKQLVRKSKDMLPDAEFVLREFPDQIAERPGKVRWEDLVLNKRGLQLHSGIEDHCTATEHCMHEGHEDKVFRTRKLNPSAKVVQEYRLTEKLLKKFLAKLK
ncbi:MAG: hypothetical protein A2660_01040 [Candidatus Doudnabacteria bacterium RIFCSPHIGHO2_01_FULL_45_18]|uniref:Uncharacterized protein n=1 Tax=Candidatus Doudnabacteria bacterium RIFCSPHIGHO2_01_FULL_45_18 TaxID=1817823 RepID=A0A1F5NRH8_9BACT|nr:MAG: hypothetical protein A2660_01040 [Candidatus Doudnabacteria bacterium RIFCSPHIGHO2_01_FULL_45_18]